MLVQVRQVQKVYRKGADPVRALDGVDLTLEAGQFVAVRGPSGCGKSTLLLMVGGLLRPDTGTVELDGEDVYRLPPGPRAQLRAAKVGFVFQQFHLIPYLNVQDNILTASLGLPRGDARQRVELLVEQFGLGPRRMHLPSELSTGERQRVALARAMLNQPRLLLADEPTGNLDPANADIVLDAFMRFASEGGAVMMVTHDAHAADHAQQVIHMAHGRIEQPAVAT